MPEGGAGLLGPGDPPPFEILNPDGAACVAFLCDHASNRVPDALDDLGLLPQDLERHIAWDIGAGPLTRALAAHYNAPAVLAGYSRLVIDCNRRLDDEESVLEESDDTPVPGNQGLTQTEIDARVEACFRPYHDACTNLLADMEARHGRAVPVIMVHSFTPALGGTARPWHVGILWDEDERIAAPLLEHLQSHHQSHLLVGDNEPYDGRSLHGYTMPFHAARHGRPNVQLEVRQDLIADPLGIARWDAILTDALDGIVQLPSLAEWRPSNRAAARPEAPPA